MNMKPRMITLSLAIGFIAAAVCLASYPQASTTAHMGTWKLNSAKSKFAPGSTKNTRVMYEAAGDDIKVTVSGIDVSGNATHNE